jgi:hypothetical protein
VREALREQLLARRGVDCVAGPGRKREEYAGDVDADPAGSEQEAQPEMASAVAIPQRTVGFSPRNRSPIAPVQTGALPMAKIVPRATPVFVTPAKKRGW